MWIALPKTHWGKGTHKHKIGCYSIKGYSSITNAPNAPPAASVAVTKGGESLRPCAARGSKKENKSKNLRK